MNDLISLAEALLRGKNVVFEVRVTVHLQKDHIAKEPDYILASCWRCKKSFAHVLEQSLTRAFRAHQQHCTALGCEMQFIRDQDARR